MLRTKRRLALAIGGLLLTGIVPTVHADSLDDGPAAVTSAMDFSGSFVAKSNLTPQMLDSVFDTLNDSLTMMLLVGNYRGTATFADTTPVPHKALAERGAALAKPGDILPSDEDTNDTVFNLNSNETNNGTVYSLSGSDSAMVSSPAHSEAFRPAPNFTSDIVAASAPLSSAKEDTPITRIIDAAFTANLIDTASSNTLNTNEWAMQVATDSTF